MLYLGNDTRCGLSYYGMSIETHMWSIEWRYFQSLIYISGAVGHCIIQRQITRKWFKMEQYSQWTTNRKLCVVYRTAPCDLEQLLTQFSRSHHYFVQNISQTVRPSGVILNDLSDLELLSKIFNELQHHAVCVRQPSLLNYWCHCETNTVTGLTSCDDHWRLWIWMKK